MIYEAKSGNATLTFNDNEADPNKRDTILYNIGDIHKNDLAEQAIKKSKRSTA